MKESSAICLSGGFIKYETNTKHSTVFAFNEGQIIHYHIGEFTQNNREYIISHLSGTSKGFGFPVTKAEFDTYFRDITQWRDLQINKILV